MAYTIGDITITSIETITGFDMVTGNWKFTLDELQNATIAQTEDKVDITGKHGRKLSSLKRNKAVTVSGTNGMLSSGLTEMQTGSEFENKKTTVMWTDYVSVDGASAKTAFKAVGEVGSEIDSLYVKNADGTQGKLLTQGSTASAGVFAYVPDTKILTFHDGDVSDSDELVVYYHRQLQADVLDNKTDTYSAKCVLYVDVMGEDKCGKVYHIQFYIPKADFNGEFSFEMGENQAVHSFEASALSGACGASGNFYTYTVFGANTEDVA